MTSVDEGFERDLAVALAAEAPRARPGFKEELRERVDGGFPRERRFSPAACAPQWGIAAQAACPRWPWPRARWWR